MIRLYNMLRDRISEHNSYSIIYQDIEQTDEESIGIYLLDGGDTKETLDNKKTYRVLNIHIQVQSKKLGNINSPEDGFNVCKGIINSLDSIEANSLIGDIKVISLTQLGNILFIGKNKENIPIFSIDYKIKYVFKEEE